MADQSTSGGLEPVLFGSVPGELAADRRKQVALALAIVAVVCFTIGHASIARATLEPGAYLGAMGFSIGYWVRVAWPNPNKRLRPSVAIATAHVGIYWLVIGASAAVAWLLAPVVPDDPAWLFAWWFAAVAVTVLAGIVWHRERRKQVALVGMWLGLLIAFGSLAGFAIGGGAVLLLAGVPVGLAVFYLSTRAVT